MRVEHGFVLAPQRVGLGIDADLSPARLADEIDLWLACAGDQGEAVFGIGLPNPVAADFGDIAETCFASRRVAHLAFSLHPRALCIRACLGVAIGARPLLDD